MLDKSITVQELAQRKKELENRLNSIISKELNDFKNKVGIYPTGFDVNYYSTWTIGKEGPETTYSITVSIDLSRILNHT
jgi:hypothetical protein